MKIKVLACELPAAFDCPLSRWSVQELAHQACSSGWVASISETTVWRWLHEDAIRPWQHRCWIFPRDPDFEAKAVRLLDLYHRQWDGVALEGIDRRCAVGKRDYAMLLLLVTYGLRAREVSALTLDDIDWDRERHLVAERKAGHCTAYPLSAVVGEALLDYLKNARPQTTRREVFFRILAPQVPLGCNVVSSGTAHYRGGWRTRTGATNSLPHRHETFLQVSSTRELIETR